MPLDDALVQHHQDIAALAAEVNGKLLERMEMLKIIIGELKKLDHEDVRATYLIDKASEYL